MENVTYAELEEMYHEAEREVKELEEDCEKKDETIDKKDKEIEKLESEISELEDKVKDLESDSLYPKTVKGELKIAILRRLMYLELEELQQIELIYGPKELGFEQSFD